MSVTAAGISSMATRQILAELAAAYEEATGDMITIESVGGVDAAKRIRAGEAFDFAVLASDALQKLEADGHLVPGSIIEIAESPMAMAVRAGQPKPDPLDEAAVRKAMESAKAIGISTGPSGTHVQKLARDWGLESEGASRLVQAKPGIPVAKLLADGEVDVGFSSSARCWAPPASRSSACCRNRCSRAQCLPRRSARRRCIPTRRGPSSNIWCPRRRPRPSASTG